MHEKAVTLPKDLPDFVQESDFKSINWDKKAVEFGERGIIGNKDKSGVIGANMPSLNTQNGCGIFGELQKVVIPS